MPVISLYAGLRKIAGTRDLTLEGENLAGIIRGIGERYPSLVAAILDGDHLRPHIIITINGQNVDPERGLEIPLDANDHIAIFPPIAGG